ncbi:MAG: hypothetical protein IKP86_07405 [Anaerolineaceae bacterium]|nr:hypothetical protein [Anaerolineaceae bacterium]
MKTAIVYYSMSGNCEFTAKKIAERTGADLIRLEPEKTYPDSGFRKFFWAGKSAVMGETPALKPYEFDASKYDRIIFGFPVWASNPTPPIRTFIRDNGSAIRGKKLAAFTCYSGGGADKALEKLKKLLGTGSLEAELILIDPMTKNDPANEAEIERFCEKF